MLIYVQKYSQEHSLTLRRNQYVMSLLHENIIMQRELGGRHVQMSENLAGDLSDKQQALNSELKINEQMQKNFNEQSEAFLAGMKIIGISSLLSLFSILVLGFLLQRWVVEPIKNLTQAAGDVREGKLSSRIKVDKKQVFFDELDTLALAFNEMTESVENNIIKIKNSELFFQSLIDAMPDGIRVVDQDYNIVLSNSVYNNQFAHGQKHQKCYEVYGYENPCPSGILNCPLRELSKLQNNRMRVVHNIKNKPMSINAAQLQLSASQTPLLIESFRDLSGDIKFSHEQKISSLAFLATSVAHEMKNNLGSVKMIVEALRENTANQEEQDAQTIKYLKLIDEQLVDSIAMPERLLNLVRPSSDEYNILNVQESILDVMQLLDYEAKRHGIGISYEFLPTDCQIKAHIADFKMIILNLSQNAFKAMPSGGKLVFKVLKDRTSVIIQVKDNGVGIEPDKVSHIFEPFYSKGQTDKYQGTGLGLAIVKSLVEKYKGSISVSSALKKGTTFEIKFVKLKK